MALSFVDNISYLGKKPLDSRHIFKTFTEMKNFNENYLPSVAICQNEQDGNIYTYNVSNIIDPTLGKWRILKTEPDISAKTNNIITRESDGLYAPKTAVSSQPENIIQELSDGLYATVEEIEKTTDPVTGNTTIQIGGIVTEINPSGEVVKSSVGGVNIGKTITTSSGTTVEVEEVGDKRTETTITHDPSGNVTSVSVIETSGNSRVETLTNYDPSGNVTSVSSIDKVGDAVQSEVSTNIKRSVDPITSNLTTETTTTVTNSGFIEESIRTVIQDPSGSVISDTTETSHEVPEDEFATEPDVDNLMDDLFDNLGW